MVCGFESRRPHHLSGLPIGSPLDSIWRQWRYNMNRFKHVCAASQNRKGQEIYLVLTGNFCVDPLSHLPCGSVNGTFFVNNSSLHTGEGISFYFSSDLATKEVSIRISLIDVDDTHCGIVFRNADALGKLSLEQSLLRDIHNSIDLQSPFVPISFTIPIYRPQTSLAAPVPSDNYCRLRCIMLK